jgi:hypothetical protein
VDGIEEEANANVALAGAPAFPPMPVTDFCIAGFPKCGTTALARFFKKSPAFHLAEMGAALESPFFKIKGDVVPPVPAYLPGRVNGHKYSSYLWSLESLERILATNENCLFLICVREAGSALVSWRKMHREMALQDRYASHFTHRTPGRRKFFSTCSLEEYFNGYAATRLHYARLLEDFRTRLPGARFALVSQRRLASDARGVMQRLHRHFGVEAPAEYWQAIPTSHVAFGDGAKDDEPLSDGTLAALETMNRELACWIETLREEQNLTLGAAEFSR